MAGPEGTPVDIGYWDMKHVSGHSDGVVMDTALCTLQLEVYYRHLPTFNLDRDEPAADVATGRDIIIDIRLRREPAPSGS